MEINNTKCCNVSLLVHGWGSSWESQEFLPKYPFWIEHAINYYGFNSSTPSIWPWYYIKGYRNIYYAELPLPWVPEGKLPQLSEDDPTSLH